MTTRNPFPGTPLSGSDFMPGLNARLKTLFDGASLPLTDTGGTANAVTASLAPVLDGDGLLDGMTFSIAWGAANTGSMALAINGGTALPVLGPNGLAMIAGAVGDGLVSRLTYWGGSFVMTSPTLLMGNTSAARYAFTFTLSGTWTKPADLPDDTPVLIQGWGAGGGGIGSAGGGGGAYSERWVRAGELGATVTVTVAPGGAIGTAGGNSTFGSLLTAYGGGTRGGPTTGNGGSGGGSNAAGGSGPAAAFQGGGPGGVTDGGGDSGGNATNLWGGGGGGTSDAAGLVGNGGRAVLGGGGGGGLSGAGGSSLRGGPGGASGVAGTAPGGGGGNGAAGARGEIRVLI